MSDADKVLGIDPGNLSKIMGVDIADLTSFMGLNVESGIQGDEVNFNFTGSYTPPAYGDVDLFD